MVKLHTFCYPPPDGAMRVLVREYDDGSYDLFAADRLSKIETDIPACDVDEINFLAVQAIESARHAKDDRLYDEWKDGQVTGSTPA